MRGGHFFLLAGLGLALLAALILATPTYSQGTTPTPTAVIASPAPTATPQPTAQPTAPTPNIEAEILRAQLEQMKESDDRLLSTVYWSLAFVGALTVVLIGGSWFTARWQYDRDRETIRQEVIAEMKKTVKQEILQVEEKLPKLVDNANVVMKRQLERFNEKYLRREMWRLYNEGTVFEQNSDLDSAIDRYLDSIEIFIDEGIEPWQETTTSMIKIAELIDKSKALPAYKLIYIRKLFDAVSKYYPSEARMVLQALDAKDTAKSSGVDANSTKANSS